MGKPKARITFECESMTISLPVPAITTRDERGIKLEFQLLATREKDDICRFFKSAVSGQRESWHYTDVAGVKRLCWFSENCLVFVRFLVNEWDGIIRLVWTQNPTFAHGTGI